MKPTVGRIVHYVAYGTPKGEFPSGACRAAIVTEVMEGAGETRVSLCVLNPSGVYFNILMAQDEKAKEPGTWHWPERVEE